MSSNDFNQSRPNENFNRQYVPPAPASLPNATTALVLGIISTYFSMLWCYWVGSIVAIVCGIIAIRNAKKAKELHDSNPSLYKPKSPGVANAGRILGIVGVCLGSVELLVLIIIGIVVVAVGVDNGKLNF
ncbi:MAG: hypothetical protein K0S33_2494 [Bacteroidetes bacterium]|jgi:hypothetical protein|nr:hypothetical protein [Bacteroidota bacterium]